MSVEAVTQAVSDLALAFSDQDDEVYAMVSLFKSSLPGILMIENHCFRVVRLV